MRCALVTGAYGYVGSRVRSELDHRGWQTVALVRRPRPGDRAVGWELGGVPPGDVLLAADALVHCAYDFTITRREQIWKVNVEGSNVLLDAAADANVGRLLVVSSMSAYPGTRQVYGSAKLSIEKTVARLGGLAVRPGLVYGPSPGGMVGALVRLARLRFLPVFGWDAPQYPVHENDLVRTIVDLLESEPWSAGVLTIAQQEPVAFHRALRLIVGQLGYSCTLVPVPWFPVYAALRTSEALRVRLPIRSDSILGLIRPNPDPQIDQRAGIRTLGSNEAKI